MSDPNSGDGWDRTTGATADPVLGAGRQARWGLTEVAAGFLAAQVLAAVVYLVVASATDYSTGGATGTGAALGQVVGHLAKGEAPTFRPPMPLWLVFILQVPLWVGLAGIPLWATRTKGRGPVLDLGLRGRRSDAPMGIAVGVGAQFALVPLVYWPIFQVFGNQDVSAAARQLTDRAVDPFSIVTLFAIVGIGAPLAEEIFFRGLAQRAIQRRWGPVVGVVATATFFAASHFQVLQFAPLLALGMVLGAIAARTRRLAGAIWAHLAFNVSAVIVSVWAIDVAVPLAVAFGLAGLVALFVMVRPFPADEEPVPPGHRRAAVTTQEGSGMTP